MAAEDVAKAVARVAVGPPLNGTVEIAGARRHFGSTSSSRRGLNDLQDPREVITDRSARYSGAALQERALLPGNDAQIGETSFEAWRSTATLVKS